MIGIIIGTSLLYVGTTAVSFKTTYDIYKGFIEYLDSKGYKSRDVKKPVSAKISNVISTLFWGLLPGYNFLNAIGLHLTKEKVYARLEEKYVANGDIYIPEENDDSITETSLEDEDIVEEYTGPIEIVEPEKDLIDLIMEELESFWQDYRKETNFRNSSELVDVEFVEVPSQNPSRKLK